MEKDVVDGIPCMSGKGSGKFWEETFFQTPLQKHIQESFQGVFGAEMGGFLISYGAFQESGPEEFRPQHGTIAPIGDHKIQLGGIRREDLDASFFEKLFQKRKIFSIEGNFHFLISSLILPYFPISA